MLIGAPNFKSTGVGAAFVFEYSSGSWQQTAVLTGSQNDSNDLMRSATMRGRFLSIATRGPWADATEDELLTAYNGLDNDYFGFSVSLSASGGYLVTGGVYKDPAETNEGAAYLFKLNGSSYETAIPAGSCRRVFSCSIKMMIVQYANDFY